MHLALRVREAPGSRPRCPRFGCVVLRRQHGSQLPLLRRVLNDTHDEALLHVRYLQKGPERCGDAALYLRYTYHWVRYKVSWWSLRAALPPLARPRPPPRRRMPRQPRRGAPTPMR
eukprot:scaffold33992_cov59-Phaeocystis_antarctica.AAC.7